MMDIAIVADISRNMNTEQRSQMIAFVNNLVDKLGVSEEGNHFSLTTFASDATLHNNFKDVKYHSADNFKEQVENRVSFEPSGWGTRTDLALDLAATQLFTPAGGDRPDVKNVMLVLTDGKPKITAVGKKPLVPFAQSTNALEVMFL